MLTRTVKGISKNPTLTELNDTEELNVSLSKYFGPRIVKQNYMKISDLIETCRNFEPVDFDPRTWEYHY